MMHKLITSSNDNNDLSIGFHFLLDINWTRGQILVFRDDISRKKFCFRFHIKVVFGFTEHQKKMKYMDWGTNSYRIGMMIQW